jgi:1-acyl-sn-glycerol-3-phosphate acyltransferase
MKEEFLINTGKIIMGCYARVLLNLDLLKLAEYPEGAKIFASNHPTTIDPFFLGLLTKEPMRIMVTANAFEVPVFRGYLHHSGHIPVDRGKGKGKATITRAVEYLNQGKNVGIFPEGALSPEVNSGFSVLPAKSGVARIALQSNKPIIPVGIALDKKGIRTKEYQFSDRDTTGRWVTRGDYVITVGAPIFVEGDPVDHAAVQAVSNQVTHEIRNLVAKSQERMNHEIAHWTSFASPRNIFSQLGRKVSNAQN